MYTLKNLRELICGNRLIFVLLVMCVTVSTLVIHFSYGIYQNYNVIIENGESECTEFTMKASNSEEDFLRLDETVDCLSPFSEKLSRSIGTVALQRVVVLPDGSNEYYSVYFSYDSGGGLSDSFLFHERFSSGDNCSGRWFTADEWREGKKVCIVGLGNGIQRIEPSYVDGVHVYRIRRGDDEMPENTFVDAFGEEYEIVGTTVFGTIFSYRALHDDFEISSMTFLLNEPLTVSQYTELKATIEEHHGDHVNVPELDVRDTEKTYLYRTILIICALVSLAAGLNFVILFRFIMLKRQRTLAIFRICGCTAFRCVMIYLAECLVLTVLLYIVSAAVYDRLLIPRLLRFYPNMRAENSLAVYAVLGTVYIGLTALITLIMLAVRTSAVRYEE